MVTTIKKGTKREKILIALKKRHPVVKGINLLKYCGIIKLKIDPLDFQKELRNEWE